MIPLVDLQAQYASIKDEIDTAVLSVLASARFALGPEVAAFEEKFAAYCGTGHAVAVNSGTSALHLALLAAGVGHGDEVITVPFTFVASVAAIRYTGATPVFVDIEPQARTIDVNQVEQAITSRTKAILPVHLYGQPADMDPLLTLAQRHHLTLIEDAAQAHGAEYRGRRVGGLGELGCFSFYPGKNLGAYGEGGIVVTNDADHARTIRSLRSWGEDRRYHHTLPGFNYRMDGIQGAILRVKLSHLPAWTDARRRVAATYDRVLADTGVTTPAVMPYAHHVFHLYAVQTEHRDALHQALDAEGIQTGLHYPVPVHLQPAYADLGGQEGDYPCAEAAATATLTLPIYPEIPEEVPARVAEIIRRTLPN
jgi:dTDP-4-amino-4,6-dideoxygalactose transaminase|tara:strand:- start:126 stop:1226 length:1101 start_codon:yes stop_codon:yes gene_type:complete